MQCYNFLACLWNRVKVFSLPNYFQIREADVFYRRCYLKTTIRQLRLEQNMSTNDVIDVLVSQQEKNKSLPLQALLHCHSRLNIEDTLQKHTYFMTYSISEYL